MTEVMTDEMLAAKIRNDMETPLRIICRIMQEAAGRNLQVGFDVTASPSGRFTSSVLIRKVL